MTRLLALFTFSLWLPWLYYHDTKDRASVSSGSWIVVAWAVIYATRPVTEWFGLAGEGPSLPQSRDEGNPVEAFFSLSLIIAGWVILLRRGVQFSKVIKENTWLFVFYGFWLMSITWSDYPFITFKRLFKDLGNIIMVLLVLTDTDPSVAIKAVICRLAYLCIPLSILFIRYYPELGRIYTGYDQSRHMWVGVTTHKNSLGVLALVGALFLFWDFLDSRRMPQARVHRATLASRIAVFLMCWYLLLMIDSVTALVCAGLGTSLLLFLNLPFMKCHPGRVELLGLGSLASLWIMDLLFNFKETFVESLGRDMTLTSRTDLWAIVKDHQDNPLVGAGFNTFWSGERYVALAETTGGVVQAHNGYIELYLNGGIVGVCLLTALLLSAYWQIRNGIALGTRESVIRLVLLVIAVVYNISEASFTKVGLLWLLTLFAVIKFPPQSSLRPAPIIDSACEKKSATSTARLSIQPVELPRAH